VVQGWVQQALANDYGTEREIMDYHIAVLPSLHAKGWGGVGGYEGCGLVEQYGVRRFFEAQRTDAMAVGYLVPGSQVFPRLNKGAEGVLKQAGAEPLLHWAIFDIDNKDHTPHDNLQAATDSLERALDCLPEVLQDAATGYTTRAGLRLMFKLDPPLPVTKANSFLRQLGDTLPLDVDPASYEWTRLFRLPRAKRDGRVLEAYWDTEALEDGATLDPLSLGFNLEEHLNEPTQNEQRPECPEDLTWQDLAHASDMEWALRGEPVPPDDSGSSYGTARTALARIAHRGKYDDPHTLAAFLWESVLSTTSSSLDLDELWKLAEWVAQKQAEANDQERRDQKAQAPQPGTVSPEEWGVIRRALRGKFSKYCDRLRDGTVLTTNRDSREPTTYAVLRRLVIQTELPADTIYRVAYLSVQKQRAPLLEEVWERVQAMVQDEREDMASEDATRTAFCTQFPLLVKAVDSGRMFHLDTTQQPYCYRVTDNDLLQHDLSRFCQAVPFDVSYAGLRTADILDRYGSRADRTIMVSGRRDVTFSPSKATVAVGVHALDRTIEPTKHADVLEWLNLLGGTDPEGLLDWLSCVAYTTDTPLCSLYIQGGSGAGKSLLAKGVASLWASAPVDYNAAMSGEFNGEMSECPLLVADEGIRVARRDEEGASQKFRSVVASTAHYVNAKYHKPTVLYGAMRVMVFANNDQGIPFRESLGEHGIQAIVERVLHITTGKAAAEYLRAIPAGEISSLWAPADGTPGKISETLAWLKDNRKVDRQPGARFLVMGKETEWHRGFTANQGIKPDVLRAISALVKARISNTIVPDEAYIKNDQDAKVVWVSLEAPVLAWKHARSNINPNPKTIHSTVKDLAQGDPSRMYFNNRSVRRTMYPIPYSAFYAANIWEE
jgi:hypothetical protein